LTLLFRAIDKDSDSYVNSKDVTDYCLSALQNVDHVTLDMIQNTVRGIFVDVNRGGPFDVLSEQEFIDYAEKNPDSLFSTWGKILQWKYLSSRGNTPADTPVKNTRDRDREKDDRREMHRAKTHDPRPGTLVVEEHDTAKKPENDTKITNNTKNDRKILSVISPRKDQRKSSLGLSDSEEIFQESKESKTPKKPKRNSKKGYKPITMVSSDSYWNLSPSHSSFGDKKDRRTFDDSSMIDLENTPRDFHEFIDDKKTEKKFTKFP